MLELYFLFYRIPKMMSALARERQRSAVAWSVAAILAWLGAELVVGIGVAIIYMIVTVAQGGQIEEDMPAGITVVSYVLALGARLAVSLSSRRSLARDRYPVIIHRRRRPRFEAVLPNLDPA